MITELITFPTYKIYPDLDIGELEEEIYYDDEIIEYEPEILIRQNCRRLAKHITWKKRKKKNW